MKKQIRHRNALFTAATAALFTTSAGIQAQNPVIEEVIVTAQKRAQSAQDIPVALTAIDAQTIEDAGIQSTQDVVRLAPSLTVNEANHKQTSSFSIRGIGTSVYGIGVEQGVALLVDDVAAVQPGQTLGSLVDIERIEILRGPQSTLFGKNASAGVINITTKAPSEALEATIEVMATDDEEAAVLGSVSGPINDALRYRLSGKWSDRNGHINSLTPGVDDKNGAKVKNLRAKLDWDASDIIRVELGTYYLYDKSDCCAFTWHSMPAGNSILGLPIGYPAEGINPGDDNFDVRGEDGPYSKSETTGGYVKLRAALGEFELMSITALDNWKYNVQEDTDFSDLDVLGFFTGGREHGGWYSTSDIDTDFFSQELRLLSPSYDKFEYLTGLYYAKAETDQDFFRNLSLARSDFYTRAETESFSVFGQFTWRFSQATSANAGLRWLTERISADGINYLEAVPETQTGSDSDSPVVGNISVQHFFSDAVMAYASYSRGYKGQAFDLVGGRFDQFKADNPADAETSDAYEIGVKSTLWESRLQLNLSAFYTNYDDFQVQRSELIDGAVSFRLDNVGELNTQGVELESLALLGENFALTLNASYIDASINDYSGAACYAGQTVAEGCEGGLQDIDNGELPVSPRWKYTAMLEYSLGFESLPFNGFANMVYTWQDDVIFNINQDPRATLESYGLANLRIGLNDKKERYRISFFVNNLFDETYAGSRFNLTGLFGPNPAIGQVLPRNASRYAGVQARYSF
ncbi:MAG: TonB-dependent receptor [Haliea sp.]|uniref:TonB-dependent receptor n=1 Tax=Haliea sp. TaxID=1932666 RepID=UPI0032EEC46B